MKIAKNILKGLFVFQLSLFTFHSNAQSLTLERCKQMAHDNYPSIKQYGLVEKSCELTMSNAAKAWLPGINVTVFGLVMTDMMVTSPLGEMKNMVYGASVMVNQVIYDGGQINANRKVVSAKAEVDKRQLDVTLYNINERVEQLFFSILMLNEQIKQVRILEDNLSISEKTVKSMMKGGMANQSDLELVNVSQLQAQQQMINLKEMRRIYVQMLEYFIGASSHLNEDIVLERPKESIQLEGVRPEMQLFASQESLLKTQRKLLNTRLMPTVGAVGVAAYHNKIMPMLKETNLMAGLTLKWNIGALYTRKNDIASLENQNRLIDAQRETFLFNNNMQQQQSNGRIESLREQMALDDKAVALRESILEKARKKVELGTETVNELLRDVNSVSEARQQKVIHEIQLIQEISKLNTIVGK